MTTVRQLLDEKGHEVFSIPPDATVYDAIKTMSERNIGALVVMDEGKPAGIITERLYARNVVLKGRTSPLTSVRAVMATNVAYAKPEQLVEQCMAIMTETRVSHLPVIDNGELVGLISIGDLVKSIIKHQEYTIEQLISYIQH
ncbi:MAG: CBS domain-containing protein [Beijerinckiaceae bacterium]|jgi:CBS domain-containing protein